MNPLPIHVLVVAVTLALCACDGEPDTSRTAGPPVTTEADTSEPAPPAGDPADEPDGTALAHWDGYGAARFGMSADEVRSAWDGDLDGPQESPECFHLGPADSQRLADFALMFGDGRFVRYSVESDVVTAPGGGRVGMPDKEIEVLYPGQVERSPHKYTDGEYLRIQGADGRVLIFETGEDAIVTDWRVGLPPQVDYVEGCA